MVGKLFIDGKDAFLEYGIFVEQYGYKEVVQMPKFKEIDTIEWEEFNGEEVDLTAPVLGARKIKIPFCLTDVLLSENLFAILSKKPYHTFKFTDLDKEYRLRMTSAGSLSSFIKQGKLQLSFYDDFPNTPTGDVYAVGQSGIHPCGYELDGIDFSQFGAYVLRGTDDSVMKAADIRHALEINPKGVAGVLYDNGAEPKFRAKDVTVKLLINCSDITEFWKRWDSLFAVLTRSDLRTFRYTKSSISYECYYKENSVQRFEITRTSRVWCEFAVMLRFTNYHHDTII